jgi:L,D-transpeptidase YcbB
MEMSMKQTRHHGCLILLSLLLAGIFMTRATPAGAESIFFNAIQKRIEQRILTEAGKESFVCHTELICGIALVPEFYSQRRFEPAWIENDGPAPRANTLMAAIRAARTEGLNPAVYHLATLEKMLAAIGPVDRLNPLGRVSFFADLDILLTDAFLLYGSHLLSGRVNPETIHTDWIVRAHRTDLMHSIATALRSKNIDKTLEQLKPPHFAYTGLRDMLGIYRDIARTGGWPTILPGPSMRPGHRNRRVQILRERLLITGDMTPEPVNGQTDVYDAPLTRGVERFQNRHGLKVDGIAGRRTIQAMNVPAHQRVRQIELNLERWRWIPHTLGKQHLFVNIADFSLTLVQDHHPHLKMRVVVGKPFRKTPVFSTNMTYLDINPYWNIPTKIAVKDILPKIRRDDGFLEKLNIKVFEDWSKGAPEVSPERIDWQAAGSHYFPYKLRQEPGPKNALGRIKFMFPNKFAVYLHDTPHRTLFDKTVRGFSSGCIRVEQPVVLANRLLEQRPEWTPEGLADTLAEGKRKVVRLKESIPVHLLYLTAWIDEQGNMQFRRDIYDRDLPLDAALKEKAPRASLVSTPLPSPLARDD